MKVTVDTNLLVRVAVVDDARQAQIARKVIREAETLAISTTCLCELVWLLRTYRMSRADIESVLVKILHAGNVTTDWEAVAAGLAALRAGADFADGLIAFQGRMMGGETFVSFDRKAVSALRKAGQAAELPT
jgi:predicted nucleic-acid-binding protein